MERRGGATLSGHPDTIVDAGTGHSSICGAIHARRLRPGMRLRQHARSVSAKDALGDATQLKGTEANAYRPGGRDLRGLSRLGEKTRFSSCVISSHLICECARGRMGKRDTGEPTSIAQARHPGCTRQFRKATRALGNVGCTSTGHPDATAAGTAYWYRRCGRRPGRRDNGKGVLRGQQQRSRSCTPGVGGEHTGRCKERTSAAAHSYLYLALPDPLQQAATNKSSSQAPPFCFHLRPICYSRQPAQSQSQHLETGGGVETNMLHACVPLLAM